MAVTVVVGGQFGSEGKGKTVSLLARRIGARGAVVRCGGPNSGHIVVEGGREHRFRLLPSGAAYGLRGFLAPAAVIDLEVLRAEIEAAGMAPDTLGVDGYSVVISRADREQEQGLVAAISSTGSGTGAAGAAKMMRGAGVRLVRDVLDDEPWLVPFVRDVGSELHTLLDSGASIVIEGTQGFGLSLHHSHRYPQVTSKDTTASQFVMEAGLSPLQVTDVVLVLRTFPIRVAGQEAGPLQHEISWDQLREECGAPCELAEFTTVTGRLRRVGRFDLGLVSQACRVNRPTGLVIHGLDYLGWENHGVTSYERLNLRARRFLEELRAELGVPILYGFTGRDNTAVVADVEASLGLVRGSAARPDSRMSGTRS